MRIIIDAMGGDNAPVEIIKGAAQAADEYGVEFIFVGDQEKITQIANDISFDLTPHKIVHTDVVITMDDDPIVVLHAKKESSCVWACVCLPQGREMHLSVQPIQERCSRRPVLSFARSPVYSVLPLAACCL